jgi:hypothetical protein
MIAGEADAKSSGTPTAPSRKLRLFGVNLDCGPEPEPETEAATAMYGYMHPSHAAVSTVPNYWLVLQISPSFSYCITPGAGRINRNQLGPFSLLKLIIK